MKCYLCGCNLGRSSRCPACNSDVRDYKRIVANSNLYYNLALEKARVRDLSGACASLKQSLRFYKGNTDARNLLGLVYFEMGELVQALSEWVISKSLQPLDNPADEYLNRIQKNQAQLDKLNANVKRYNMALQYCNQGALDLAVLQLKKVCSSNYTMLKAQQLLALLYIHNGEYERARACLKVAAKIDVNNTTTLLYQKELSALLRDSSKHNKKKQQETIVVGSTGDYVVSGRGLRGTFLGFIINLLLGVIAGGMAVYFLVVPGVRIAIMDTSVEEVREANERLSSKESMVQAYKSQIEDMQSEIEELQSTASGDADVTSYYSRLLSAYAAYVDGDTTKATEYYASIDKSVLGEEAVAVYDKLATNLNPSLMSNYYALAQAANEEQEYDTAIEYYEKMIALDESYLSGGLLYELAEAYSRKGRSDDALTYYQKVVDDYPDSTFVQTAKERIEELED